jgi:hypothetical protein
VKKRDARSPAAPTIGARAAAGHGPGFRVADLLDARAPYLLPLVLLAISRIVAWLTLPIASEDAYITFRYAKNLASGYGLVYNPGEQVMGFTSPLWALWTALGFVLRQDPLIWTRATSLAGDAITLWIAVMLLRRHASNASAWTFGLFFATWPYFAVVAMSGMENSAMLTLIALAAALGERRHPATGPVLALLALARPEGAAVALLLAFRASWRDRIVAAALAIAAFGALTAFYGSAIPQSLLAKSQIYGTPGVWAGRHWWEWLFPMALGRWPVSGEGNMMMPLAVVFAPAFVVGAIRLWRARATALAWFAAGALAVWAGYAVLGVAYFYWYMVVPLAGIALVAAVGLPHVVRGKAIPIACLLFILGTWSIARVLYVGRTQNEFFSFGGVSTWLADQTRPGEKIMLEPIGIIGYRSPLVVIDEVGLVSPAVARRRLQGPGWYTDVARLERPEWLVIRSSVRGGAESFAGRGAPFRSPAERDTLFAHYERRYVADPGRVDLEVWRRFR